MTLPPPLIDTLRWDDLVRQGRAQLPLVAPGWTDQNVSDPGIAVLELLAWLVESAGFRSGAVTDRERRILLALAGSTPRPPQPARCLVTAAGDPGTVLPAGLVLTGTRHGRHLPLTLTSSLVISGVTLTVLASAAPSAAADGYRSGCADLTHDLAAGRTVPPLGDDPRPGSALLLGLGLPPAGPPGPLDLFAVAAGGLLAPETASGGAHHSAVTGWEWWNGAAWQEFADGDADDDTAALTRTGRVRLRLPAALTMTTLGDQSTGVLAGRSRAWLRCRLTGGRHDAPPALAALHPDAATAVAAHPYSSALPVPAGAVIAGAPPPAPSRAVVSLVVTASGDVAAIRFDPPAATGGPPAVDVLRWTPPSGGDPGRLVAGLTVLGVAAGIPGEAFRLPAMWCGAAPLIWVTEPDGTALPVRAVADLAVAGPRDLAATFDPDGVTVRFGDGRHGRTPAPGATVLAAGTACPPGVGAVLPPMPLTVPDDERTAALAGPAAATVRTTLLDGLAPDQPAEDVGELAARTESRLWVHDVILQAVRDAGAASLDDLPLATVRALGVPERAVTGPDVERIALATPGTALWRARALPEVDPRLPGLRAAGCVTVVVVPSLPLARPAPAPGLLARIRAQLEKTRTLGTRVFVTGPDYVVVGAEATLVLVPGADPDATTTAAEAAIRGFLHPVTGGPGGRGWPFGRAVHRSEVLQLLDQVPGVDHVDGLVLSCEPHPGSCGDITIGRTQLALAGTIRFTPRPAGSGS
ncbi:baseplate J/gp47 family protein [Actinoplanes regularis]|uniref:Putative baseplate assembly protein n=1 Tax=Actinoplanes regularis TaxID=52697 RepID=A0A239C2Z7_9ACTN|nr:baseplate J/gp47 family protein [Actinoplanes regularis]GIE88152.1 putative baseplate assembly protein [Actinoplanes regularis]SNS14272.1 putative baseplate assembly protein [Actinoplanes regularis]